MFRPTKHGAFEAKGTSKESPIAAAGVAGERQTATLVKRKMDESADGTRAISADINCRTSYRSLARVLLAFIGFKTKFAL